MLGGLLQVWQKSIRITQLYRLHFNQNTPSNSFQLTYGSRLKTVLNLNTPSRSKLPFLFLPLWDYGITLNFITVKMTGTMEGRKGGRKEGVS